MISIPLEIKDKRIRQEDDLKRSIDSAIGLLLQTPRWGCKSDPNYGFVLRNLQFEVFNENEGTVHSPETETPDQNLYTKKVSGSSKNFNSFAAELKTAIEDYESRLYNVGATLTYVREEKTIYVTIEGLRSDTRKPYQYETTIRIWN